jgi:hypothetical protein
MLVAFELGAASWFFMGGFSILALLQKQCQMVGWGYFSLILKNIQFR